MKTLIDLREGQTVCVSAKALFESDSFLDYGTIVIDYDEKGNLQYYDIYNEDGEFACCDGEECIIEQIGEWLITLVNNNGDSAVRLTLTKDEASTALFI